MTWILRREVEKVVTVASQRHATTGLTTLSSAYQVMSADRAHECEHHGRGRYRGSSPVVLIHIFVGRAAVFLRRRSAVGASPEMNLSAHPLMRPDSLTHH